MGTLYIVATPIGNMEDITIRAQNILASVDLVLCEDTRRTAKLTSRPLLRFDEHTEQKLLPEIVGALSAKDIALVSDAGTPLISDPGFTLVREAIKRGIKVVSIPGPTAAITALTSSGLPTNAFLFLGYPPEKQSKRTRLFGSLLRCFETVEQKPTVIFYCAPHKLRQTLTDMESVFGDIEIVVCRELTKVHEEVWRGNISVALMRFKAPVGEMVILLEL